MVKALARAFRWRKMLDTGVHATFGSSSRSTRRTREHDDRANPLFSSAVETCMLRSRQCTRPVKEMNDPHVETLHYAVTHSESVAYDKAGPLEHEEPGFGVQIENLRARIRMKDHYPTAESARAAVEPFLRNWEFLAALRFGPDELAFRYESADIIERNPTPGNYVLHAEAGCLCCHGLRRPNADRALEISPTAGRHRARRRRRTNVPIVPNVSCRPQDASRCRLFLPDRLGATRR